MRGDFAIVEGVEYHSYFGVGVALEGMKTACGAVLIATTTKDKFLIDDGLDADGNLVGYTQKSNHPEPAKSHSGSFRAVDKSTGQPVPGMPYRLDLPDGTIIRGVTDADGYTRRVTGHDPATVKLSWETDASNAQS